MTETTQADAVAPINESVLNMDERGLISAQEMARALLKLRYGEKSDYHADYTARQVVAAYVQASRPPSAPADAPGGVNEVVLDAFEDLVNQIASAPVRHFGDETGRTVQFYDSELERCKKAIASARQPVGGRDDEKKADAAYEEIDTSKAQLFALYSAPKPAVTVDTIMDVIEQFCLAQPSTSTPRTLLYSQRTKLRAALESRIAAGGGE